ncbi:AlpA family phage regulatory protein [Pseudomonas aeruginosa]|uniref:helix-turn-helix transcriptional regulator n=1 Tax=Pseudomonas aeruginosa TaxID=287 RepID=UPI001909CEB9|nr:AlpA family phage regulatory protein [Pseudomonas aeruginosa]MBK3752270.1 AlpA family phage regulatory protein [Pseudomonas aeruginosa]MBK3762508.1 AlpA family phage regulatory protein [Pseudomonas aeruginosa]MBK3769048.1 AlpA family phage regulatory protein [Pseudomonas aeruginosa]MBK3789236.1 AlpA family phage regulatory protein [Pseudomonas aeruginosa]MBK3885282.1 AlpA family phage regulatory protein [Pseudomonas aeruginosa]
MTDLGISQPSNATEVRLVRMPELLSLTSLSRSTAHRLMKSDPTFPKPVKLSDSTARNAPVAFVLGEVQAWIQGRIEAREEGR